MRRFLVMVLMAVMLALPLAGCGKKARPEAPGEDRYPQQFPAP